MLSRKGEDRTPFEDFGTSLLPKERHSFGVASPKDREPSERQRTTVTAAVFAHSGWHGGSSESLPKPWFPYFGFDLQG